MSLTKGTFDELAEKTGFPVDQLSFIAGMVASLFLAILYNLLLSPRKASRTARLSVGLCWGVAIGWLCYASDVFQLIVLPAVCYVIIHAVSPHDVHWYIFTLALTWLSINHIYRQVTDYGGYKLDITGPLMLIVQRVTYVGYALHDGLARNPDDLSPEQKLHSLNMLLAGPSCSYFEYMEFIDGSDIVDKKCGAKMIVARKTVLTFLFLCGVVISRSVMSVETCTDPKFISSSSLFTKMLFGYAIIGSAKLRYYFAWTFADAINNAAGLGFNGYDKDGNELWDKYTICNVKNIELATSCRTVVANWNITTVRWLKRTVYERRDKYRVVATFVVSALWHGFYPGYYLCFISVGFLTLSARVTRRSFRGYFQGTRTKQVFYEVLTWFVTAVLIVYNCVVFILLHFETAYLYWRSMYFIGHILALAGFASPWISSLLGMRKSVQKDKVNGLEPLIMG